MSPAALQPAKPKGLRALAWKIGRPFWSAALGGQALPPWDDYWYQRPGYDSASGMAVSPETAMRLSAVYACVRVISESLASLPLIVYRRLPNGGKERATDHPLYKVLHDAPNQWQTSLEFYEMMQAHAELRGNAFARIVPGPRGAVDQLIPLHPDLVQVYRLANGRLQYQVRSRFDAEVDCFMPEEMFHLRGLSTDGLVGLNPVATQRDMLGRGLAMQDHGSRFFANSSIPSGVLEYPGTFKTDAARAKFAESWKQAQSGQHQHRVAVLEDGLKYTAISVTNKDAQFLEASSANREEICSMFRVPPHKIAILTRATNNNIEHQGIEFVTDCIRPRAVRWERRMNLDLIDPVSDALGTSDEYFAEFLVDGLLRGDLASRYAAYAIGRQYSWLTPNDVCRFENMNPIPPEKGGDDYLRPLNFVPTDQPVAVPGAPNPNAPDPAADPNQPPPDSPDDEGQDSPDAARDTSRIAVMGNDLVREFASQAAGRMVRKEVSALRKMLADSSRGEGFDSASFIAAADRFYAGHVALVAQTVRIPITSAAHYVKQNLELLRNVPGAAARASVIDWIEDTGADALVEHLELSPLKKGKK